MFASILGQFTLLEELDDSGETPSEHDLLLGEITDLSLAVAQALYNKPRRYIRVYPRYKAHFWWRRKKVGMWRLNYLYHPIWLGEDGEIYRGEGPMSFFSDLPDYCQLAEHHLRDANGLQRIIVGLHKLLSEHGISLPTASAENGVEV